MSNDNELQNWIKKELAKPISTGKDDVDSYIEMFELKKIELLRELLLINMAITTLKKQKTLK